MKEILVERKVTKVTDNTFLATLIENQKKEFDELVYTLITIFFFFLRKVDKYDSTEKLWKMLEEFYLT